MGYLRQKNPFLFSIFSFPQLSSSFLFQTAKLLQKIKKSKNPTERGDPL